MVYFPMNSHGSAHEFRFPEKVTRETAPRKGPPSIGNSDFVLPAWCGVPEDWMSPETSLDLRDFLLRAVDNLDMDELKKMAEGQEFARDLGLELLLQHKSYAQEWGGLIAQALSLCDEDCLSQLFTDFADTLSRNAMNHRSSPIYRVALAIRTMTLVSSDYQGHGTLSSLHERCRDAESYTSLVRQTIFGASSLIELADRGYRVPNERHKTTRLPPFVHSQLKSLPRSYQQTFTERMHLALRIKVTQMRGEDWEEPKLGWYTHGGRRGSTESSSVMRFVAMLIFTARMRKLGILDGVSSGIFGKLCGIQGRLSDYLARLSVYRAANRWERQHGKGLGGWVFFGGLPNLSDSRSTLVRVLHEDHFEEWQTTLDRVVTFYEFAQGPFGTQEVWAEVLHCEGPKSSEELKASLALQQEALSSPLLDHVNIAQNFELPLRLLLVPLLFATRVDRSPIKWSPLVEPLRERVRFAMEMFKELTSQPPPPDLEIEQLMDHPLMVDHIRRFTEADTEADASIHKNWDA